MLKLSNQNTHFEEEDMWKAIAIVFLIISCAIYDNFKEVVDTSSDTNYYRLNESKAELYVKNAFGIHKDSYGLLLPLNSDNSFRDQGDALIWNSVYVASLCLSDMFQDERWELWQSIRDNLITEEGRPYRHPSKMQGTKSTSISKDGMIGFLYLGAIVKYTNCPNIVDEYPTFVERMYKYGKSNDWEYGIGNTETSVTLMANQMSLDIVLKLYGIKHSVPVHIKDAYAALEMPALYKKLHKCQNKGEECDAAKGLGAFQIHLNYLATVIAHIGTIVNGTPRYSSEETEQFLLALSNVGLEQGYPNWLYIATYRHFVTKLPTYNDVNEYLSGFPAFTLPNETIGAGPYGCTDYIWQRVMPQGCSENGREYIGADYLHAWAWTL